jgi:uncharacterized membrane protein YhaH (DUF805 family)
MYLVAFLVSLALFILGCMLLESAPFVGFLVSISSLVFWYVATVGRAHDFGKSWRYLLLPSSIVWLFFTEGDRGDNLYGPDPRMPVVTDDK